MIEIALCLAIIGFALVSILLVLPSGMNTQRQTREETIISQDASMLLEAIRNGSRGLDDLTNNVYAITNYWTAYKADGTVNNNGINGYTRTTASINGITDDSQVITNGLRIIGLMSTPEFAGVNSDDNGRPIPSLNFGGVSNHVVAYVRSFSGLAAEKPPQDNSIMQADAFSYRLLCINAPLATDTNIFYLYPRWQSQAYNLGDRVFYNWVYWRANANTLATDVPGQAANWTKASVYSLELVYSLRELRLLFLWPQLPNGNVGAFRQSFRASVGGQLVEYTDPISGQPLYFYKSQSYTTAP
jgi:type II secretory pathway pseudopilin PulG